MPVLSANNLRKHFGERAILDDVSLTIKTGERAGLVGMNGSGKSTLARILAGLDTPDHGQVVTRRNARLAYLEQEPRMNEHATALQVVLSGLDEWSRAVARHDELSAAISRGKGDLDAILAAQAEVAAEVERLGGWDLSHQAEAVLGHLGIHEPERPVGPMSGGERRRVALARLLVSRPDVAILDEPTNHLDIATIEWLESYLRERFAGALLLITHDRYLLDRVVTRTLEIEHGALYSYDGAWEEYLTARAERDAHAQRVEANRQNLLRRELEWLSRQPKARTTKQKARIDRAGELMDKPGAPAQRSAKIAVQTVRTGHTVIDMDDVCVDLAGRRLIDRFRVSLGKGERVGIIGPNGCGKTTLLRVIMGEIEPAAGAVRLGKSIRPVYLDQRRSGLDPDETVLESVGRGRSHVRLGDSDVSVHAYLERFLFPSRNQSQKIATLSGGERARVALARLLCDQTNLVILDEPTNDLDVTTLATLEQALTDFAGTALVVTHDRWFLDRVATSILAFEPAESGASRVVHVHGNYQDYLDYCRRRDRDAAEAEAGAGIGKRRAQAGSTSKTPAKAGDPAGPRKNLTYGERIELDGLLERIDAAEREVAELEAELESPGFYERDHKEQAAFLTTLAEARGRVEALVERWAELEARNQP